MKLDRLNALLTLAANLGVIGGIIFLGLEIQQNTRIIQAAAIQDSTNVARQQILMFAADAETNRIAMIGSQDPAKLSPEEKQRFFWINRSFWLGMQGLYRQWDMGVLPDEEWGVFTRVICNNHSAVGDRVFWPGNKKTLIPAFIDWVEQNCMALSDTRG